MRNRIKIGFLGLFCMQVVAAAAVMGQDLGGLLGSLNEVIKPEVAERLELTDEQLKSIGELRSARMRATLGLGQQLKEASLTQGADLRAAFGAESEELLTSLLDAKQRDLLGQERVKSMGMLALQDPQVAEALNLDEVQEQTVSDWAFKLRAARRSPDEARVRDQAQRAIRQELSDSQWVAWQVLAGQADAATAPPAMPPERSEPATQVAASGDRSPSDVSTAPATPTQDAAATPIDEIRLTMNFNNVPWRDVIDWLAEQADMSLQNDIIPPGSFKYRDLARSYSITEALDIMNGALLDKGYTLFRQGRMLRCLDFETQEIAGELISELADLVDAEELAKRGQYEPVKYLFSLTRLDPDELKPEVEQLLSIQGKVVSLPAVGQLQVTDMAANVRAIGEMIRRAEDPNSSRGSAIRAFVLKHIVADEILAVARPHLGLEEDANTSDEITISTTTFGWWHDLRQGQSRQGPGLG